MAKSEWNMIVPVISTSHMPNEHALNNNAEAYNIPDGWLVYVGSSEGADYCGISWFAAVIQWVRSNYEYDVSWIRFDSCGDVIDELETWEW